MIIRKNNKENVFRFQVDKDVDERVYLMKFLAVNVLKNKGCTFNYTDRTIHNKRGERIYYNTFSFNYWKDNNPLDIDSFAVFSAWEF